MMRYKLLDTVVLDCDLPDQGLQKGDLGRPRRSLRTICMRVNPVRQSYAGIWRSANT
jgi:hypothetical protein